MNTTYLSLHFYDSPDPKIFFIQDVSVYNPDIATSNTYLSIIPPNFSTATIFEYPTNSLIPINSNLFKWTATNSYSGLSDLPDGLYEIDQSVSPNCAIQRSYNYFRITALKTSLLEKVSDQFNLQVGSCFGCSKDESWYKQIFEYLQWLDMAKYMAEECGKIEEAKIIYNQISIKCSQIDC